MKKEKLMEEYFMPGDWLEIANKILKDRGAVLVLGATDTGKSICTLLFANFWAKHGRKVGIVDVDMGQSDLGPPTTMGMVLINKPTKSLKEFSTDSLYFIGSTSPINYFLPIICGTKKLIDEGKKKGAEIIIVDTTGLVKGNPGRTLKENMIDIISPSHIVALQREDELEHILKNINLTDKIVIHRLSSCTGGKRKTYFQRREAREEKFRKYFKRASSLKINLANLNIKGSYYCSGIALGEEDLSFLEKTLMTEIIYAERTPEGIFIIIKERLPERFSGFFQIKKRFNTEKTILSEEVKFENLLVSLDNRQGFVVSLGIIQKCDFKQKIFTVFTPLEEKDLSKVFSLKFGAIQLSLDGKELGKVYPGEI
ncbi:MAG: Clp1/GlmU family protein [Atribacterota bacterium]|nr:Clp1/GlmU family protein [Atribacterota bacterium]